jgi:5-amino-6-(5-phosphoribosylamino)uracil reductase
VTDKPYVLLSVAASIDGYIDDATGTRLRLSNDADFDRVDAVRATVDAILVGAHTIRQDNPRLLVRSEVRRAERVAQGRPPNPVKVTVTAGGDLDPSGNFFTAGDARKIVYTSAATAPKVSAALAGAAEVVAAGDPVDLGKILADLHARGVGRLMVEGGMSMHTQFLTRGLADEIQLVVAPFFIGDDNAPRFVGPGVFPQDPAHRLDLAEARPIGDCVLLRYLVARADELSRSSNDTQA